MEVTHNKLFTFVQHTVSECKQRGIKGIKADAPGKKSQQPSSALWRAFYKVNKWDHLCIFTVQDGLIPGICWPGLKLKLLFIPCRCSHKNNFSKKIFYFIVFFLSAYNIIFSAFKCLFYAYKYHLINIPIHKPSEL